MKKLIAFSIINGFFLCATQCRTSSVSAQSLGQEQIQEKRELESMGQEIKDIKKNIGDTLNSLNDVVSQMSKQSDDNEIHLLVKEGQIEIKPGKFVNSLTFNGKVPGPTIRAREGAPLRVVLHNQSKNQTSLTFHGLILPQSVAGLPRKNGGAINPGETYVYQFIPTQSGTFWYHPQVNHLYQKSLGLYGALIVEPAAHRQSYDRDYVLIFGQAIMPTGTFFVVNGSTGSNIKPLELRQGERIRLRLINATASAIPLTLTGHKLEIIATNGSDALEPHVFRDTLTLNAADRVDAEFTADNPGVWSLASEIASQASDQGSFPGGIACVVKYLEFDSQH